MSDGSSFWTRLRAGPSNSAGRQILVSCPLLRMTVPGSGGGGSPLGTSNEMLQSFVEFRSNLGEDRPVGPSELPLPFAVIGDVPAVLVKEPMVVAAQENEVVEVG